MANGHLGSGSGDPAAGSIRADGPVLRLLDPTDEALAASALLVAGTWPDTYTPELAAEMAAAAELTVLVAAPDGSLAATACVLPSMLSRTDIGPWLGLFVVAEGYRGKGLGTEVLGHVMAEMAGRGCREMWLYTRAAEGFYAARGWDGREDADSGQGPVKLMRHRFAGPPVV